MKKLFLATAVATTLTTTAFAGMEISGKYEGTLTDGNPGASTYAQDLDLTLKGTTDDTSVTATIENLAGGDTVTTNELYIETSIEGINFKGGKSKGMNGNGLLQKKSSATNKIQLSTDVAGFDVAVNQTSGDGNATVDLGGSLAGVNVSVQNAGNDTRYVTASTSIAGLDINVETQETASSTTNTGASISTTVAGMTVTGVVIDVEDASGITQDDGILGDISDATANKDLNGVVVTTASTLGELTGKYINKNDKTTYVGEVERGVWTFGYSKTEDTDGVATAKINVAF